MGSWLCSHLSVTQGAQELEISQSWQMCAQLEDFTELHVKKSGAIKQTAPRLPALVRNSPYSLSFEVFGTKKYDLILTQKPFLEDGKYYGSEASPVHGRRALHPGHIIWEGFAATSTML